MPAVSLGTAGVAGLCSSSANGSSLAPRSWRQAPDRLTATTGRGVVPGRTICLRLASSGEWGGVLLADGSWRGEGAGQQVAGLVVGGAGARVAQLGGPVPGDGKQPGAGQVPGHRDRVLAGQDRVAGVAQDQDGGGRGPVPRAWVTVLGRGGRPVRARLRLPRRLQAEGARPGVDPAPGGRVGGRVTRVRAVGAEDGERLLPAGVEARGKGRGGGGRAGPGGRGRAGRRGRAA